MWYLSQYLEEKERNYNQRSLSRITLFRLYPLTNYDIIFFTYSIAIRLYSSSEFLTQLKVSEELIAPTQFISSTNFESCIILIDLSISSFPISSSQTHYSSWQILHSYSCCTSVLITSYFSFLRGRPFFPVAFGFTIMDLIYEYVPAFGCLFFIWV